MMVSFDNVSFKLDHYLYELLENIFKYNVSCIFDCDTAATWLQLNT